MATASAACSTAGNSHLHRHHHSNIPNAGGHDGPSFGMQKGARVQPGKIFWQGHYVDQSQFYRVSFRIRTGHGLIVCKQTADFCC